MRTYRRIAKYFREDDKIRLYFPRDKYLVAIVKTLPDHHWIPELKCWQVPARPSIARYLQKHCFKLDARLQRLALLREVKNG